MRKYPLELQSGDDTRVIDGVGPKIAARLDDALSSATAQLDGPLSMSNLRVRYIS